MANPNHLLVEDRDTQGAVIGLMRHYISWPTTQIEDDWPVKIEVKNSSSEVLNKKMLGVKFKESGLNALGLIVDANSNFMSRWKSIREICSLLGATPPSTCPEEGLILSIDRKQFGVWIMPNNKSDGMLESFCHTLVPVSARPLWEYAQVCTVEAQRKGAPFRAVHRDKTYIHTWLAWQDPPGERMGTAITKKILDSSTPAAKTFVQWFKDLFKV